MSVPPTADRSTAEEATRARDDAVAFVFGHTTPQCSALVPEIKLRLAQDSHGIFAAAEAMQPAGADRCPPYWAFAWPGGQALARYLLDHPAIVQERRIVDVGAGSGIAAIAAAMAGAPDVLAADIDPRAAAAIELNAVDNARQLRITGRDLLADIPDADLVLIGDLVYEPELATRVGGFLEGLQQAGIDVLLGDRTTARRPSFPFDLVAEYAAPLTPELEETARERGRVWRLVGQKRSDRRRA